MSPVTHWDEVAWDERSVGEIEARTQDLGTAAGTAGTGLRRYDIAPGKRSSPPHVHGAEEEIFFLLRGTGLLWQDGATCEVSGGDCIVHRPEEEAHTLRAGDGGLEALVFGQRIFSENTYHPHAGRVWAGATVVAAEGPKDMYELDALAGPLEFASPAPRPANVVALDDVEVVTGTEGDVSFTSRGLSHAAGSQRSGLGHDIVPAGMLGTVPHSHSAEEEIFVILDGDGVVLIGDDAMPVRAGHVAAFPPGTGMTHAIRGGERGITYLTYGTRDPNDIAYYPRSNKIAFRGVRLIARLEALDYWDGER
jgi:uncharacterized cupin superfamily protein